MQTQPAVGTPTVPITAPDPTSSNTGVNLSTQKSQFLQNLRSSLMQQTPQAQPQQPVQTLQTPSEPQNTPISSPPTASAAPTTATPVDAPSAPTTPTQDDYLDELNAVLTQVEQNPPQSQSQALPQSQPQLQPQPQPQAQPSLQVEPVPPTPTTAPPAAPIPAPPQPPTDPNAFLASSALPQVVPSTVLQATDTLNPAFGGVAQTKEVVASQTVTPVESATGIQQVEVEPQAELPPEVEGYLQKVENDTQQAPKEIVLADGKYEPPVEHPYPSQPVVVLPITPQIEEKAKFKSPKFSIRWLVEWSHKIIKIFMGKVIYRQA